MNQRAFLIISDNGDLDGAKALISKLKDPVIKDIEYVDCADLKGKTGLAKHILGVDRIDEIKGDRALKKMVIEGRTFLFFNLEKDANVAISVIRLAVALYNNDEKVDGSVTILASPKLIRKQLQSSLRRFRLIEKNQENDEVYAKYLF